MCRAVLFVLGKGKNSKVLLQKRGWFMGGRFSKIISSLVLGGGEGRLFTNHRRLEELRLVRPGIDISQVISLLRIIDGGAIASRTACVPCLGRFLEKRGGSTRSCLWEKQVCPSDPETRWKLGTVADSPSFHTGLTVLSMRNGLNQQHGLALPRPKSLTSLICLLCLPADCTACARSALDSKTFFSELYVKCATS